MSQNEGEFDPSEIDEDAPDVSGPQHVDGTQDMPDEDDDDE